MSHAYNSTSQAYSFLLNDSASDFDDLSRSFFPEFSIVKESDADHLGDHYYVKTCLLDETNSEDIIRSKIKTLTHLFRGANHLAGRSFSEDQFKISKIMRDSVPIIYNDSSVPFTDEFNIPSYTDVGNMALDIRKTINFYMFLAIRDIVTFNCLMFASERFDYIDLYKLYESIKAADKEMGLELLKPFEKDIDKFTCSANNFSATRFASRHATGAKFNDIKHKYISIDDSRRLFIEIMDAFSSARGKYLKLTE